MTGALLLNEVITILKKIQQTQQLNDKQVV